MLPDYVQKKKIYIYILHYEKVASIIGYTIGSQNGLFSIMGDLRGRLCVNTALL